MSSNAAFAVAISIEDLARALGRHENRPEPGWDVLKSTSGEPLRVRVLEDCVIVHTETELRGLEPEALALLLRSEVGAVLDAQRDARGVLAFPDSVRPKATRWADLVEELDGIAEWVAVAAMPAMPAMPPGLEAVAAQVMGALGPDLGDLQQKLMSGDPEAMGDVSRRMQDLLASPAGAGILQALQGVDLGASLEQAQSMFGVPAEDDDEDHDGDDDDDGEGEARKPK